MMVVDAGRMMKLFKYEAKIFVGQKQQKKNGERLTLTSIVYHEWI